MPERAMNPKLLLTVSDFMESSMITAFLEDAQIPVLVRDLGGGGVCKITLGYSVFGQELYVDAGHFERASELVKAYFDKKPDDSEQEGLKKHPFGCF